MNTTRDDTCSAWKHWAHFWSPTAYSETVVSMYSIPSSTEASVSAPGLRIAVDVVLEAKSRQCRPQSYKHNLKEGNGINTGEDFRT